MSEQQVSKVAVLGLYSSGSSAVAGVLKKLGVCMGGNPHSYYFEPGELSKKLRRWWVEPELVEATTSTERVDELREWVQRIEDSNVSLPHQMIGAKHPLLSLCANELLPAWGRQTRFIWSWRPIERSIISLANRGWFPGKEVRVQKHLWKTIHEFFGDQPHLRVEFDRICKDPESEVRKIHEFLEIEPTKWQFNAAVKVIQKR